MVAASRFRRLAVLGVVTVAAVNVAIIGVASSATPTGTASGVVYRDANNNGVRDATEVGVAGIVVSSPTTSTVTNGSGAWSLQITGKQQLQVYTGWYRTQCNGLDCPVGPGADQDFKVEYQKLVANANAANNPRLDVGVTPDWNGSYPIPRAPILVNATDVSLRISFLKPTGNATRSNCFRTKDPANRACAIGDRPQFLVQVYNEGTTPIPTPSGHLQIPAGTQVVSITPSANPANHAGLGPITYGALDPATRRIRFTTTGTLAPGAVGLYNLTLEVLPGAPITTSLQTSGEYPNPVGVRLTSLSNDAEGDICASNALTCPWGVTDRQVMPDNSDTVGFAIVAAIGSTTTVTPAPAPAPAPTLAPAPVTTTTLAPAPPPAPATTTTTTVPATTTTRPPATAPATTTTTRPPAPTTTLPPAPPPPNPGCTVSDLLVPSCGAWFGAATPSLNGGFDYAVGLTEYEAASGNSPDIQHFYKTGGKAFPTQSDIALAERPGRQRSLLLFNWKPSGSLTWRQVADGGADSDIVSVASGLRAYPHKLFLNIYHEPEDNVNPAAGSGMTPEDYADMYRHVVDVLRGRGVSNAVYVWNVMGYSGWDDYLDGLYPGDSYVDWIAYDPYGKGDSQPNLAHILDATKSSIGWPGFYTWATSKAPGKPIMLGEWGFDVDAYANPGATLAGQVGALQANFPMLKALVFWNAAGVGDYRLTQNTAKRQAYVAAFRTLAADPYFNSAATADAP